MMQIETAAVLSRCGRYRYSLSRCWDKKLPKILFVGLNPSTADAEQDDPTIRRCIRFAKESGFGTLLMGNLFAVRATKPSVMLAARAPEGFENNRYLLQMADQADLVVASWGVHGHHLRRDHFVCTLLGHNFKCLGLTRNGFPRHPLYVRADTKFQDFEVSLVL